MRNFVLDSFALMAYVKNEVGSKEVSGLVDGASKGELQLYLHVINWGEVYYSFFKKSGEKGAKKVEKLVNCLPIEIVEDVSRKFVREAAVLKGKYLMSYADVFAANLAIKKKAKLVTGDPEIRQVAKKETRLKLMWLGE